MKTFQGNRPREDVITRFQVLGWEVNERAYVGICQTGRT